MKSLAAFPRFSIEVQRDEIPVNTLHPTKVPDEKWRFVDANGHGHFWDKGKLPTLEEVVTGKQWVGDEYDGEEYDITEWRCRDCGEVVKPKHKSEYGPRFIEGPPTFLVTIEGETYYLTPEQYAQAITNMAADMRRMSRR